MLAALRISEEDWHQAPTSVRRALATLWQHVIRLNSRCAVYEHQVARLQTELASLQPLAVEVTELRERLGLTSRNSSKSPSSDPPHQRHHRRREPSGRKIGGQSGHPGRSRTLQPLEQVDRVIDLRPECCQQWGGLLLGEDANPARHQVSEIPRPKPELTEDHRHTLTCMACGAINHAEWPAEMSKGGFGPRVQATVAFLTGRIGGSHPDVVEVMETVHGVEMGWGSVPAIQQQVSAALAGPVQVAEAYVQRQPVNHVDETGWREGRTHLWLWVNATAQATLFKLLPGRRTEDAKQIIGHNYLGFAGTDRFEADNWLGNRRRQICRAHLTREWQAFVDREGESAQIGQQLLEQVKKIFDLWHQVRERSLTRTKFQAAIKPIQGRVGALLRAGIKADQVKTQRTCRNILKVEAALWTFVRAPGVEPTNNASERALRRAVLWRRKSFGT